MSYILEALKKAEQERELGQVPGLEAAQPALPESQSRRWIWILGGGLLLNAIVMAAIWSSSSDDRPEDAAMVAIVPAGKLPPGPVPVEPEPAPTPAPTDVMGSSAGRESGPQAETPIPMPAVTMQRPLRSLPLAAPKPAPVTDPGDRSPVTAGPIPPTNAAAQMTGTQPADSAATVEPDAQSLPKWPQVPRAITGQVNGELTLNMHVYSDNPDERFVLINMHKYREGQEMEEGPTVERIVPKSAILGVPAGRFLLTTR